MPKAYKFTPQKMLSFKDISGTKSEAGAIKIHFHETAFAKMAMLIDTQPTEVAWHGVVSTVAPFVYEVEDILVYPQIVSDMAADTEQVPYQTWLMSLEDDVFFKTRMRGHSHANYPTIPSDKDYLYQSKMVYTLKEGQFYIFMIWNKSFGFNAEVYYADKKLMYTGAEVEVVILSADSQPTGILSGDVDKAEIMKLCDTEEARLFLAEAEKHIEVGVLS